MLTNYKYSFRKVCTECNDVSFSGFRTKREYKDYAKRYKPDKCYKCKSRESGKTLTMENREKTIDLIVGKSTNFPHQEELYFDGSKGFVHGPGFNAYSNEFPEGTIMRITVEIILP